MSKRSNEEKIIYIMRNRFIVILVILLFISSTVWALAYAPIAEHKILITKWQEKFQTKDYKEKLQLLAEYIENWVDAEKIVIKGMIKAWDVAESQGEDPYEEIKKGLGNSKRNKWIELYNMHYENVKESMDSLQDYSQENDRGYKFLKSLFDAYTKLHNIAFAVPREPKGEFKQRVMAIIEEFNKNSNELCLLVFDKNKIGDFAFRNLRFGDSKLIVDRKLQGDLSSNYHGSTTCIGNYNYDLSCSYTNDKLYRIDFYSRPRSATYYSTEIKDEWENLVDTLSKKYGEAYGVYKEIFELNPGYISFTHTWITNTKKISVGVGETKEGYKYYAVLVIVDLEAERNIKQKEQDTRDSSQKKSSQDF